MDELYFMMYYIRKLYKINSLNEAEQEQEKMVFFSEKERIEKLRFFGETDSALEVTSPSLWLAVLGGVLFITGLILWMIFGRIPRTITVQGVYRGNGQCVCFADLKSGKAIDPGMEVKICPDTVSSEEYGNITASVSETDDYDTDIKEAEAVLGSVSLAAYFLKQPSYYFICTMEEDEGSVSGYKWTSEKGRQVELKDGTLVSARVSLGEIRPIALIFPALNGSPDSL